MRTIGWVDPKKAKEKAEKPKEKPKGKPTDNTEGNK